LKSKTFEILGISIQNKTTEREKKRERLASVMGGMKGGGLRLCCNLTTTTAIFLCLYKRRNKLYLSAILPHLSVIFLVRIMSANKALLVISSLLHTSSNQIEGLD
jgi:hypothetical protein